MNPLNRLYVELEQYFSIEMNKMIEAVLKNVFWLGPPKADKSLYWILVSTHRNTWV